MLLMGILLAGCENDDSPMQSGDSDITVLNDTDSTIHIRYSTQTWDVLWPGVDVDHEASTELAPRTRSKLSVHFSNQLGTSRISVTKDGIQKDYDVGFGDQRLTIRNTDFTGD